MLTSITIENFKGIRGPVKIPIRPLTIMFGKNSAGKSTLIHALHYVREVLLNNNPNADKTTLGGESIDLGGFKNLVHKHQFLDRSIKMRFDFEIEPDEFPEYDEGDIEQDYLESGLDEFMEEELGEGLGHIRERRGANLSAAMAELRNSYPERVITLSTEFEVTWSETLGYPIVSTYKTSICGEPAAQITTSVDARDFRWEVNATHTLSYTSEMQENAGVEKTSEPMWAGIASLSQDLKSSLPNLGQLVYLHPDSDLPEFGIGYQTVTQMVTGPMEVLLGYLGSAGLKSLRYIGPLRKTAPRNFRPISTVDEGTWADGTAAWSKLYDGDLITDVSDALVTLKTGYALELQRYREIPIDSELMLALQTKTILDRIEDTAAEVAKFPIRERVMIVEEATGLRLAPHDIGVGISQVVPVVVAAVTSKSNLIAIEQPELHLHPAVQAELGDLFIAGIQQEGDNIFFLETHSEHLILRVLRRIRESEEGLHQLGNLKFLEPDDVSLLFIEPGDDGTSYLSIPITSEGDLERNVPGGFFAERADELF